MAGSVNKVILVGNLGKDPETRRLNSGDPVVNLRIATSESWKDKATGERKEKTEWHNVVIFNENLARVAEQYLRKGSKVYVEGQLQTRKWTDQSGQEKYTTEVVLQRFRGELTILDGRGGRRRRSGRRRPREKRRVRPLLAHGQAPGHGRRGRRRRAVGLRERPRRRHPVLAALVVAAVSWSGGKDCCLALHRARAAGLDIRILVAMFDESGERTRSHGVPRAIMQAQADALGLELVAPSASWADYERVFIETLTALAARGIADVVFGDIDLQPHREWEEKVCAAAGLRSHLPLWQENRQALAGEILALGYRAVVVCTDDRWLGARWCGRAYDRAFLAGLPDGVDLCGENGEFHTFVTDGPLFRQPVPVHVAAVDSRSIPFGEQSYTYHFARLTLEPAFA